MLDFRMARHVSDAARICMQSCGALKHSSGQRAKLERSDGTASFCPSALLCFIVLIGQNHIRFAFSGSTRFVCSHQAGKLSVPSPDSATEIRASDALALRADNTGTVCHVLQLKLCRIQPRVCLLAILCCST